MDNSLKLNSEARLPSSRNCKTGVPQGAVSSPILFNFYMSALPTPPDRVKTIQYADDISIYISGTDLDNMTNIMNDYVEKLLAYLKERELEVSPTKSTVTLFTPDTKEASGGIYLLPPGITAMPSHQDTRETDPPNTD